MGAQRLDARAPGVEESALGVEHLELARDTAQIAKARKAKSFAERLGARGLGFERFARARLRTERSAYLAERGAHRLQILLHRRALACLGGLGAGLQPP